MKFWYRVFDTGLIDQARRNPRIPPKCFSISFWISSNLGVTSSWAFLVFQCSGTEGFILCQPWVSIRTPLTSNLALLGLFFLFGVVPTLYIEYSGESCYCCRLFDVSLLRKMYDMCMAKRPLLTRLHTKKKVLGQTLYEGLVPTRPDLVIIRYSLIWWLTGEGHVTSGL